MPLTLHSLSVYKEILVHTNLKLMTKLTDHVTIDSGGYVSAKEQSEALRSAWISNTEVKLLERKTRLVSPSWYEKRDKNI